MDELIVDMKQVSCYDIIEQYCADTVKQLNHLQKQRYAVCLMFNATKASEILACYLLCCTSCCDTRNAAAALPHSYLGLPDFP